MKSIIRQLSLFLCMIMLGSILLLSGCHTGGPSEEPEPEELELPSNTLPIIEKEKFPDSTYDFIQGGNSDYTIVYPEGQYTGTKIQKAADTIRYYVQESSGIKLPIKSDAEFTGTSKIISLGKTNQSKTNTALNTLASQNKLGTDGYIVDTNGNSIYLYANDQYGVLYAAYKFLNVHLEYEYYAPDCYSLTKNVTNLKLKEVEIVDIPDFQSRTPTSSAHYIDEYRCVAYTAKFNDADKNFFVHNWFGGHIAGGGLLPKEKYASHSDWYDTSGTQLCLEARGNEEERQLMRQTVVAEMIRRLEMQPDRDWIAFSQNDGGAWCSCSACQRLVEEFGNKNTAAFVSVIRFANMIADDIKAWNEANCPERNIKIFVTDYGTVRVPPVKTDGNGKPIEDENGNYMPLSEELTLRDNVSMLFCFGISSTASSVDDMLGDNILDEIKRTRAVMSDPQYYIWCYSASFKDYLVPFNKMIFMKAQYEIAAKMDAVAVFDQGRYQGGSSTDWEYLCGYVSSKLLWDLSLDVNTLIYDFFNHYFLDAADEMYEIYKDYYAHTAWQRNQGAVGQQVLNAKYWPYYTIHRFLDKFDVAYKAIEGYQTSDPKTYELLRNRIKLEELAYRYLELWIYPEYFSVQTYERMKEEWVQDAMSLRITQRSEYATIEATF